MKLLPSIITAGLLVFVTGCWQGTLKNHSDIGWGGRAVAVSIDKLDEKHVLAVSPTGGMFRTGIAGAVWGHHDGFPEFNCYSVRFFPANSKIVVATCIADTKAANGGGIWISSDAGSTWTHPPSSISTNGSGQPMSAYGIAFRSDPMTIYVGTSTGLAVSQDLGQHWNFIDGAVIGNQVIYSVLALDNGKVVTFGDHGIRISDNGATSWYQDNNKLATISGYPYSDKLAASPISADHLFCVNGNTTSSLYYSVNGGHDWSLASADLTGVGAKYPGAWGNYVKAVWSDSGRSDQVDLYYATGGIVGKSQLTWNGSGYDFSSWKQLTINHTDNHDLMFTMDGKTMYAATDGGLEKSTNGGTTWVHCGYADNGYDAMQVYDATFALAPQQYTKNHAYFGTQDINLYSSSDDGNTWPQLVVPEGGNIQVPTMQFPGYVMTYYLDQGNCKADALFQNASYMQFPFNLRSKVYYVRNKTFMALGTDDSTSTVKVFASSDDGQVTWTDSPITSLNQTPRQHLRIAGSSGNPSIIAPFSAGGVLGLLRVDNAFDGVAGNEVVTPIPLPSGCNLGTYGSEWINGVVSFGVDPTDPDFIIVPDVAKRTMWITSDGGGNWSQRDDLFNLITDNGAYLFSTTSDGRSSCELQNIQVTSISFDPRNPSRILIGTTEAGVVYSSNHGVTWAKIKDSKKIPYVTSASFDQTVPGAAMVSSYGRGLWTVSLDVSTNSTNGSGPRPFPRILVGKTPGDRDFANKLYHDTNTPSLYVANGPNGSSDSALAGSPVKIVGVKWPMKSGETNSIGIVLDGNRLNSTNLVVNPGGSLQLDLPPFSTPGGHKLTITESNPLLTTLSSTNIAELNFNVLPKDKD